MRWVALVALTVLFGCGHEKPNPVESLEKMKWLLGDWFRTNNKPGRMGWESWAEFTKTEWHGESGTLEGPDTLFHEVTRIILDGDHLYFIADVPENNAPVRFEITSVTDSTFTCENPTHDFPKKIHYRFDGSRIHARVSAGDEGVNFEYERKKD